MVDLDFPVVEYDSGSPAALVELKHIIAKPVDMQHPTIRAITKLADMAGIPFLIARYNPSRWTYEVTPGNSYARQYVFDVSGLSEEQYVRLLYSIRGRDVPQQILRNLSRVRPDGGRL
jgi:hypothetical protein